jgi:hypothetical protein
MSRLSLSPAGVSIAAAAEAIKVQEVSSRQGFGESLDVDEGRTILDGYREERGDESTRGRQAGCCFISPRKPTAG